MSDLVLKSFDGVEMPVTKEQAYKIAESAGLIAITGENGEVAFINPKSIASIVPSEYKLDLGKRKRIEHEVNRLADVDAPEALAERRQRLIAEELDR